MSRGRMWLERILMVATVGWIAGLATDELYHVGWPAELTGAVGLVTVMLPLMAAVRWLVRDQARRARAGIRPPASPAP